MPTDFPVPPGTKPLWCPQEVPGEWTDVCGLVNPPDSYYKWKVRLHGVFTIPRETLGLRPKDQSFLNLVGNQDAHEPRGNHEQRVLLKERSCPHPPNKERGRYDDKRDRSLSSLSSVVKSWTDEAKASQICLFLLVNCVFHLVSCFASCHTAPCAYVSYKKKRWLGGLGSSTCVSSRWMRRHDTLLAPVDTAAPVPH